MEKKLRKSKYYRLQFVDRPRFMASSLLKLVYNLSKGIIKLNANTDTLIKSVYNFLNTQIF